ncbi:MAG: 3-isopropylmalate dehydrogenase [Rikenellaceae bacterium]
MQKVITVLPGDGIGPEIVEQAVNVLKAIAKKFGHNFIFQYGLIGAAAIDACSDPYPAETHRLCIDSDAILFGAIGDPKYDDNPAAKVRPEQGLLKMRRDLGLYANIRPVELFPSLTHRSPLKEKIIKGVDMIVVRELTGGIYFGEPRGRSEDGSRAFDTCVYSKNEVDRISRLAFKMAKERRGVVTLVDKANVLATSRLWREVVTSLHKHEFSEVTLNFLFVDNAAMQLVTNPSKFDILLTENMFGDILSDQASVLTGSIGLLPSASFGEKSSLFEPIHGSYPQAAGKNIANPLATILSAAMMLNDAFHAKGEAQIIKKACNKAVDGKFLTEDLAENGKAYSTTEVGDRIVKYILNS